MRYLVVIPAALLVVGCVATVTPPRVEVAVPAPEVYVPPPPPPVVSVYVEPPISQPPPIAVGWAPPAMLVETPPPSPFPEAVWVGGYWVWQGNWVWAHGHWMGPPRRNYAWVHPYYEARDGVVIFIAGHWSPPGVAFVPPPPGLHLTVEVGLPGVVPGPRPIGPNGCFVPPPPGSRPGFIVPAPVGTAPAVVTGAPPVVAVGMRITANTTINNRTTNITNITNVTIVAPAGATAGGKALNSQVPARANLAAAQPSVVKAMAPEPASTKPIPNYTPGSRPVLPPAQAVNTSGSPAHSAAAQNERGGEQRGGPNGAGRSGNPQPGANAAARNARSGNKSAVAQNNAGPRSPNGGPNNGANGARQGMKHEQASATPANRKPPQAAANKDGPKAQDKGEKKPNAKKDQKKDQKKDEKKEHESEPGK